MSDVDISSPLVDMESMFMVRTVVCGGVVSSECAHVEVHVEENMAGN